MSGPATRPEEIGPDAEGTSLRIRWGDAHVSLYEPLRLRLECRCAACVDEMTGVRRLTEGEVDPGVYPLAIHYVGRYALRFDWSDGHTTGIYPFELLRALCSCGVCTRAGRGGD